LYQKPRQFYIIARIIIDSSMNSRMNSRLTGSPDARPPRRDSAHFSPTNRRGIFEFPCNAAAMGKKLTRVLR
jgi:hypothetical protein